MLYLSDLRVLCGKMLEATVGRRGHDELILFTIDQEGDPSLDRVPSEMSQ